LTVTETFNERVIDLFQTASEIHKSLYSKMERMSPVSPESAEPAPDELESAVVPPREDALPSDANQTHFDQRSLGVELRVSVPAEQAPELAAESAETECLSAAERSCRDEQPPILSPEEAPPESEGLQTPDSIPAPAGE
jgi:hypothetical protein